MKTVIGKTENGVLTISLSGNVNSKNAGEVEAAIAKLRKKNADKKIVIDAENLEYISSAGLRIILRLNNENPEMKIINASSAVYEVFEMTGFTEMLTIEKAYRKFSVDGCEIIGQGANGVVYRLDVDTIIKVYRNPDSLPEIKKERELARKAFVLGIPTAIPYDVVKVGDGYGSVFELLNAKLFSKLLQEEPEKLDTYVSLYIDLLKKLHSTTVKPGDMPSMKEIAVNWVEFLKDYLPEAKFNKLKQLVSAVPETMTMIHGDYHIKNIMMQKGEVLLIDMDTLSYGHPVFELSQMYLAYIGFGELDHAAVEDFFSLPYALTTEFWNKAFRAYLGTDDEKVISAVEDKIKTIAYTRLMRRTIRRVGMEVPEGRALIEACKKNILELVDRVDSLVF